MKHPAKYSDALIPVFARMLSESKILLDPFGGTGKIFSLYGILGDVKIHATELEPEWAKMDKRTVIANVLHLPYSNDTFDSICTSPAYGNRMADKFRDSKNHKKKWTYITYAQYLGRNCSPDNGGSLQWGKQYKNFHIDAWLECRRVLKIGGTFVLNIKNHIRNGKEMFVSEWHVSFLQSIGFDVCEWVKVPVPSMKFGENNGLRISYENVIKMILKS